MTLEAMYTIIGIKKLILKKFKWFLKEINLKVSGGGMEKKAILIHKKMFKHLSFFQILSLIQPAILIFYTKSLLYIFFNNFTSSKSFCSLKICLTAVFHSLFFYFLYFFSVLFSK